MFKKNWKLEDPRKLNRKYPETWELVKDDLVLSLVKGQLVQLLFVLPGGGERMWVCIEKISKNRKKFIGILVDIPTELDINLDIGSKISFSNYHIIDIDNTIIGKEELVRLLDIMI